MHYPGMHQHTCEHVPPTHTHLDPTKTCWQRSSLPWLYLAVSYVAFVSFSLVLMHEADTLTASVVLAADI